MSKEHTPGPWRFERSWVVADTPPAGRPFDDKEPDYYLADGRGGYVIAETVTKENGPLLAAAPALLSVVAAFVEWAEHHAGIFRWEEDFFEPDEGFVQLCNDARAAIAKARGGEVPA